MLTSGSGLIKIPPAQGQPATTAPPRSTTEHSGIHEFRLVMDEMELERSTHAHRFDKVIKLRHGGVVAFAFLIIFGVLLSLVLLYLSNNPLKL